MDNQKQILPHSEEAEEAVLGSMLLDPWESIGRAIDTGLRPEAFHHFSNQALYEILIEMDTERIDAILIAQHLKDVGALDKVGGFNRLIELQKDTIVTGHVESYAKIIMEKHRARLVIENCGDAIKSAYGGENPDLVVIDHVAKVEAIAPPSKETMDSVVDDAKAEFKAIASGEFLALPIPYRRMQERTFGIPIRAVTPLIGRDKSKKSRLLCTFVEYWLTLDDPIPTLVFAFEDTVKRYTHNLAATIGRYDGFGARRSPSPQYCEFALKCMDEIKELPIKITDEAQTVESAVVEISKFSTKHGGKPIAVVVDGWKDFIESGGKENRTQAENHMFETLKKGAVRYDAGVVCIEHTHDIPDDQWITKRNIKGSKQRVQSARMALILQDAGIPQKILEKFALGDGADFSVLDCCACSYGEIAYTVLRPELEKGRFVEVTEFTP